MLPAAAEAKLDGSGVGIMKVGSWATDDKNAGPVGKKREVRGDENLEERFKLKPWIVKTTRSDANVFSGGKMWKGGLETSSSP